MSTSRIDRRHLLQGGLAVVAGATVGLPAVASDHPVPVPAEPVHDPALALVKAYRKLDREWDRVIDRLDAMEEALPAGHPARRPGTLIVVGSYHVGFRREIIARATEQGLDPAPFLARWRNAERRRKAARRKAGMLDLERRAEQCRGEWHRLRARIARTSATTVRGVHAKARVMADALNGGNVGDEYTLARSIARDLERLAAG